VLLTGGAPLFLQRGSATAEPPWWPPHKLAGHELAPYLEAHPELLLSPARA
jgi:sulfide:quinone oxidoreductase